MKSNEELLRDLKKELNRIGTTNRHQYDLLKTKDQVYSSTLCRRFDLTWKEIIEKIGMKPRRGMLPKDVMLRELKDEFERLGSFTKPVFDEKRNKDRFPHPRTLIKYLEMSWSDITKECGRKEPLEAVLDDASDEDLIEEYKKISNILGKPATVKELKDYTAYSYDVYRQHFGTLGELRKACGFSVNTKRSTPIVSKEDCEQELLRIYKNHGQVSYSELKELSSISVSTMFRKFHTTKINLIWEEVLNKVSRE
ncbi:MAG: homing endonuclease associated repeat-containing protein [Bacillota bacterium]